MQSRFAEHAKTFVEELRALLENKVTIVLDKAYEDGLTNGYNDAIAVIKEFAPPEEKWVKLLIQALENRRPYRF